MILLAGTLIAVVIVFVLGMAFFTARDAILAGFAWESLLNKTLSQRRLVNAPRRLEYCPLGHHQERVIWWEEGGGIINI